MCMALGMAIRRPDRVGYKAGMSVQNLIFERALAEEGQRAGAPGVERGIPAIQQPVRVDLGARPIAVAALASAVA